MSSNDRIRNIASNNTFMDWWTSIPIVTRHVMAAMFAVTFGSVFKLVPMKVWLLDWSEVFTHFQIWRPFFSFFFMGPLGLPLIFDLFYFYRYSRILEEAEFYGNTADYTFMLVFCALCSLPFSYFFPLYFMAPVLLYAVLQIWARRNAESSVSIFFVQVPAAYFPMALLALNFVMNKGAIDFRGLFGILVGHLYYFLDSVYPFMPGRQPILKTPQIFYDLLPSGASSQQQQQQRGTPSSGGPSLISSLRQRQSWGSGHRLGDS